MTIIKAVIKSGRQAMATFIDYSAEFDTISHRFLDESLASAGVSTKVRCIIRAIYSVATGMVRIRLPSGETVLSELFAFCAARSKVTFSVPHASQSA